MDFNKKMGWTILLLISFSPIIPWYLSGDTARNLTNYADITHAIGQLAGLIGMTMFALTFLLSTRIRFIEDLFGGLDKVYIVHGVLGGSALILILFHPIFLLLKFLPMQVATAAQYLLPGGELSVDLGIYALLGMILLIVMTLYWRMKYHQWKFSHKFLGAVFILAVFHVFLIKNSIARDNIFEGYFIFTTIVSAIGLCGFFYSLLLKDRLKKRAIYRIDSINRLKGDVHDITMSPQYKPLEYKSGQFVFVRFYNERLGKESHPFSIASKSDNPQLRIVIKNLGDYTSRLNELSVGDQVSIEGPYGRFNYKRHDTDQIWIAAGIGVTPFIGMAEDLLGKKMLSKIDMYYSVSRKEDLISFDALKNVEKKTSGRFKLIPWITSERGSRLSIDDIRKSSSSFYGKEVCICGPVSFKNSIKEALINSGVPKSKIFEEEFGFR